MPQDSLFHPHFSPQTFVKSQQESFVVCLHVLTQGESFISMPETAMDQQQQRWCGIGAATWQPADTEAL